MKKHLVILSSLLLISALAGCNNADVPHSHSFDLEHWEQNMTHHWHASTCEHTGFASDLGEHVYNSDGICTICNHARAKEVFGFTFRSDFCDLDNESIYEEGEEVKLNLTLKDEFKTALTIPNEIEVFSDGVKLNNGNDYTYEVIENIGKLTLEVRGDIVVQVFRYTDTSAFRVNEEEFNFAMNAKNYDYIQYDSYISIYTTSVFQLIENVIEYSPNVAYLGRAALSSSDDFGHFTYSHTYVENVDSTYIKYSCDNAESWKTNESNVDEFNNYKYIDLKFIYGVGDSFTLNYDAIKDNFNQVTNAYEISFTANGKKYEVKISFFNQKLISVSYTSLESNGYYGGISVSYEMKDPVIPEEAKPHVHSYSSEWSNDETNHWHEATCSHTDEKSEFGEHVFGDDNICDVCDYVGPVKYSITYSNWPEFIGNPNPTSYTGETDILFDLSPIKNMSGFKNVSSKINGQAVPGIVHGTTGNIVVEICYTLTQTSVTFDPNKGELLSNDSYIFVDFRNGEDPVKVPVPNTNDATGINLYDPEVLTIPKKDNYVFKGFSVSILSDTPLNETEINDLENGSTIYALWENKNGQSEIPFMVESEQAESMTASILIPENVSKIKFNFEVGPTQNGKIQIIGEGALSSVIFDKAIDDAMTCNDVEIDVTNYKKIILIYSVESPYPALKCSLEMSEYDSLYVRASASSNPVTKTITYLDTFESIEPSREDHTFIGWFDASGKEYEIGKTWINTDEEVTLYAQYKYNKISVFASMVTEAYNQYLLDMDSLTFLSDIQFNYYKGQLGLSYQEAMQILNENAVFDYETAFQKKNDCIDALSRIFFHASEENLNAYKAIAINDLENIVSNYLSLYETMPEYLYNQLRDRLNVELAKSTDAIHNLNSIDAIDKEVARSSEVMSEIVKDMIS